MTHLSSQSNLLSQFRHDGYVVIRGLFPQQEVDSWRSEAVRLQADAALMNEQNVRAVLRNSLGGGQIVDRLDPVIDVSPIYAALVRDDRILSVAGELLQDRALLMKDKLVFKSPGAYGYTVHQDYTVWHELSVPADDLLSVLLAIDPSNGSNGGVEFYPGLHHAHYQERSRPRDLFSPNSGVVPEEALRGVQPILIEVNPGDAVFFSSLTPHRSGANYTREYRRALFFTYSAARYGDQYASYYVKFRSYLLADHDQRAMVDLENDNRINAAHIEAYAGGGSIGLSRKTGDGQAPAQLQGGTDGS